MLIYPITQLNTYSKSTKQSNSNTNKNVVSSNYAPSFGKKLPDFFQKLLDIFDNNYYNGAKQYNNRRKSCAISKINRRMINETSKIDKTAKIKDTELPKKPIKNRYALIEEYEKIIQAQKEFQEKTFNKKLSPQDIELENELLKKRNDIFSRLKNEHQSIIKTKKPEDFQNEAEKKDYIINYVLKRMFTTEESAFDALDMFEKFGFRADYERGTDTTITMLCKKMCALPKDAMNDNLLKRFLKVFDKFAINKPQRHPDDEQLEWVLTDFVSKSKDISQENIVDAINILKRITCQKCVHERLESVLITGPSSKFKNCEKVIAAMNDFKETVKNKPYTLGADDR